MNWHWDNVFKRHPRIAYRRVGDVLVLVDVAENTILRLNETGAFIWEEGDGKTSEEIATLLQSQFDVSTDEAKKDVKDFLTVLAKRELLDSSQLEE